jgi:hypothetical protein
LKEENTYNNRPTTIRLRVQQLDKHGDLPLFLRAVGSLSAGIRYAMFALPMLVMLLIGATYLAYSNLVCDPLYRENAKTSANEAPSSVSTLRGVLPPDYKSNTALPVPRQSFGRTCR